MVGSSSDGPPAGTAAITTLEATVVGGRPGPGGYRRLEPGPGEPHLARTDLGGPGPRAGLRPLLAFVQVSDLHIIDAQSPARAEFLDRLGDPDSSVAGTIGPIGSYRPQESLSFHVVEAMARSIQRIDRGPLTGEPLSFVISTGDNADNSQRNELDAYVALLDGAGTIVPDSGSRSAWEGIGSPEWYDVRYWHPDGTPRGEPDDLPRSERGFPTVRGILDACRVPFRATGVGLPWYEVHGNHDQLILGTLPGDDLFELLSTGTSKPVGLAVEMDPYALQEALGDHANEPPDITGQLGSMIWKAVTADPSRGLAGTAGWLDVHRRHGTPAREHAWYAFDAGPFRGLVLDTVNANGGWQGSLDQEQWAWLQDQLDVAAGAGRRVLLFSHHPLHTLTNGWAPGGDRRILAAEVEELLGRYPNVVAWFNGHTHLHRIAAHPPAARPPKGGRGWWEVTTAAHADWPQQARVVEIAEDAGTGDLVVITTVVDHRGLVEPRAGDLDDVTVLAGWSRELAFNRWQRPSVRQEPPGRGVAADRNTVLVLPRR